jgi:beta-glucosidase-like glycosyl hydrolase
MAKCVRRATNTTAQAGLDVDCAFGAGIALDIGTVHSALRIGAITMADVELALSHLFSVRMRLGHFDPPGPLQRIPPSAICDAEGSAIARSGAAQGSTLLKNSGGTLPLKAGAGKVAVIGPNGELSRQIAGCANPTRPSTATPCCCHTALHLSKRGSLRGHLLAPNHVRL